jgi:oligopeptide transport system permease protein
LVAALVVHVGITVLPGDPIRGLFGFRPPSLEVIEALREQFHLNEPYLVQFWFYLRDVLTLNLGISLRGGSVNELFAEAWPFTARLVGLTMFIQLMVGVIGGLVTAMRPRSWMTRFIIIAAVSMTAIPIVLSTPVLQSVFGIRLHWFPITGVSEGAISYVLPALALASMTLGTVIIFVRSELQQVLRAPFIQFAAAAGIPRRRVVGVHALRAALPTIVTYLTSNLSHIVLGLLVVENFFRLPGLGRMILGSIQFADRSVLASLTLLITAAVIGLNWVSDIVVAALDPRVRQEIPGETGL